MSDHQDVGLVKELAGVVENPSWYSHSTLAELCEQASKRIEELERERDVAQRKQRHIEYWYATRLEPIKDAAKRAGIWPEVAAIIANGSGTRQLEGGSWHYDPPTYAQQLNIAEHKAQASEARAVALEGALRKIVGTTDGMFTVAMPSRLRDEARALLQPVGGGEAQG